jgi:hypothetical protein
LFNPDSSDPEPNCEKYTDIVNANGTLTEITSNIE